MNSRQLEEVVKNNLMNYEARYDANDWNRMEGMLGTTTDSKPFNWKLVLIIVLVLGVLGGGYAIFTTIDFSKPAEKPVSAPVVKKTVTPPVKTVTPPVIAPPVINQDSLRQAEEEARIAKEEEEQKVKLETEKEEEARIRTERRKREEPSKEEIELRRARRRALATSDSGKTKEDSSRASVKEPQKKEKSKSSGIGLNIFSTFNADSLKKYQEKLKKDSIK